MTTDPYSNGNGHLAEASIHDGLTHQLEEPVQLGLAGASQQDVTV